MIQFWGEKDVNINKLCDMSVNDFGTNVSKINMEISQVIFKKKNYNKY